MIENLYNQKYSWYRVLKSFCVPTYHNNSEYINFPSKSSIDLEVDDIFGISKIIVLEKSYNIISFKGKIYYSHLYVDFINLNNLIFQDITKEILRDNKINKILESD